MPQFDFLTFDLPSGWTLLQEPEPESGVLNLVSSDGVSQVVLTSGYAPDGQAMQALLEDFVTGHTHGRLLLEEFSSPAFEGVSAQGIPFVARHQASRSFEDAWLGMYWVLKPGDYVQALLALALRVEDYEALVAEVATFVDGMEGQAQPAMALD